ncbi:hypothetical protein HK405_005537, partial [Cladochytrium tenue]
PRLIIMKAVVITEWLAGIDGITVTDVPDPVCPENGILVRVQAVGLNYFDILMVTGQYQIKPKFPFVPGAEFAGTVIEVGPKSKGYKVGDRVFGTGTNSINCYAEKLVVVPTPVTVFKVPERLSLAEAAAVFMNYPTVWTALANRGQLKAGEVCLVHAGAGGVGSAAIHVAKSLGAIVIATAGSDEKCDVARREGADFVINYSKDANWPATVNKITAGIPGRKAKGADVILDPGVLDLFDKPKPDGTYYKPLVYTSEKYVGLKSIPKALNDLGGRKTYGKVIVELPEPSSKL